MPNQSHHCCRKHLPVKYLGCNLVWGRKKISYFLKVVNKIEKKHGGRLTLIKHVIHSIPLHILSAFEPPKAIINRVDVFSNFFWGRAEGGNKYHRLKWSKCCYHALILYGQFMTNKYAAKCHLTDSKISSLELLFLE